jgi:hypothetical protein
MELTQLLEQWTILKKVYKLSRADLLKIESIALSETASVSDEEASDEEDESQTDSDASSSASDDPPIASPVEIATDLEDDEGLSKELLDLRIADELSSVSNEIDPVAFLRTNLASCDGSLPTRNNKQRSLIQEMD